ncbi:MAG: pyruvate formate-lyase-activating protein [Patescibacteria group bacterium]
MLHIHSIETFGTHDGPGIRLVLFLQGCIFRCLYCQNPDARPRQSPEARDMTSEQIVALLQKQKTYFGDGGGLTVSGGEPTVQADGLIELFTAVKKAGFSIALDTCGAFFDEKINRIYELADVILLDVKHIDPEWHKKITGQSNENPLKNADYAEKIGKRLWLRYVLVPGWSDQPEHLEAWAKRFSNFKHLEKVEILPYHTLGVHKYKAMGLPYQLEGVPPATKEQAEAAKEIFDRHLKNVVVR